MDRIEITGAREHNLKGIDVVIPRDKLVVVTGLSGSGKSSLAFDTIYAEGQRRYMETLSAYARQFMQIMERPAVDSITGLSPIIAIEQKTTGKNPPFNGRHNYGDIRFFKASVCPCGKGILTCYRERDGKVHYRADSKSNSKQIRGGKMSAPLPYGTGKKGALQRTV